jgi:hypothetical protein
MGEKSPFGVPGIPQEDVEKAQAEAKAIYKKNLAEVEGISMPGGRDLKDALDIDVNVDKDGKRI